MQRTEPVRARVGYEIASLVGLRIVRVSAALAEGQILDGIHAIAVLDVVVGMIQQVAGLHLQRQILALGSTETAANSEVDLLRPWSVKRIQTGKWTRAGTVDAECRIGHALQGSAVVQDVAVFFEES